MATQFIRIKGVAKWAKVYANQKDTKFNEGGVYTLTLYPDAASTVLLKSAGSRVKWNEDEDGKFIKLSKDHLRVFKDKDTGEDKEEVMGPPEVGKGVDEEGYLIPFSDPIGNGSVVDVKVAIYDSKFGKGTRLEQVNVLEHVPYEDRPADGRYKF